MSGENDTLGVKISHYYMYKTVLQQHWFRTRIFSRCEVLYFTWSMICFGLDIWHVSTMDKWDSISILSLDKWDSISILSLDKWNPSVSTYTVKLQ